MRHAFKQIKDGGEFVLEAGVEHALTCCDCGLVHNLKVRRAKGKLHTLVITARRDNRATAQRRRFRHPEIAALLKVFS